MSQHCLKNFILIAKIKQYYVLQKTQGPILKATEDDRYSELSSKR